MRLLISLENKQEFLPVGRVALIPISAYITNKIYRSIETLYTNIFCLYGFFLYAYFCRDEGNPTYEIESIIEISKEKEICATLSHKLIWSHFIEFIKIKNNYRDTVTTIRKKIKLSIFFHNQNHTNKSTNSEKTK